MVAAPVVSKDAADPTEVAEVEAAASPLVEDAVDAVGSTKKPDADVEEAELGDNVEDAPWALLSAALVEDTARLPWTVVLAAAAPVVAEGTVPVAL